MKELTPTIAKEVEVTFQESVQASLGILPETVNKTIEEKLAQPWGKTKFSLKYLEPLRAKAKQVKAKLDNDIREMVDATAAEGKKVSVEAIKKGVNEYLSIGKDHPAKPIAVNITASWPYSKAQQMIEELHAEVMFHMRPAMTKFMQDQKESMSKFLLKEIKYVKSVLFKREARFAFTKKLEENIIKKLHGVVVKQVEAKSGTLLKETLLMSNKMLRTHLYQKAFLKDQIEAVNALVKVG